MFLSKYSLTRGPQLMNYHRIRVRFTTNLPIVFTIICGFRNPSGGEVMRRIFAAGIGLAALMALAGPSAAADLGRRSEMPVRGAPYLSPLYNWSGFYAGINGGGGWGSSSWDSAGDVDVSGGVIGGTLGVNYQVNQAVFGLEGDLDWSNLKGTTTTNCALGCETRNDWLGTVRGRAGFAFDRFLPYFTGGVAFGNVKASTPGFPGGSETKAGWTLGAGLEFAVAGNITAKVEYLHVDLGSFDCSVS
jgi:outer membrane immunogenic protein